MTHTNCTAGALRQQAEAAWQKKALQAPGQIDGTASQEMLGLLHELQVHQIELELQNEELRCAQLELEESRAHYFDLYDMAPLGYCTLDEKGLILEANLGAATMLGANRGVLCKKPLSRFIFKADQALYFQRHKQLLETGKPQTFELRLSRRDGSQFWARLTASLTKNGSAAALLRIMLSDVSERRKLEQQMQQQAFHDCLTELPNRRLLTDRLRQTMELSARSGCHGALMFLDLDNFKPLNDTHGHEAGDLLLIEVARRLSNCVRQMDTVARVGGDEFVVMIQELEHERTAAVEHVASIAEIIRCTLAEPYVLHLKHKGQSDYVVEHRCSASIGVAVFLGGQAPQKEVMRWADDAMYQAKAAGRNVVRFYEPEA